ncbi:MAG: EthD family reductase [Bacteroidota bacterium]
MRTKIFLLIAAAAIAFVCQPKSANAQVIKKGMIKVAILYPNAEGNTFDMNYYTSKHFPMLRRLFGDSMKATAIDKGIAGRAPGEPVPYLAIGYLYFESITAFQDGMKAHGKEIRDDIPRYTNITPVVQISEVVE